MKVSETFSLEIEMSEFYKFAIPLVGKQELNFAIKEELKLANSAVFDAGVLYFYLFLSKSYPSVFNPFFFKF